MSSNEDPPSTEEQLLDTKLMLAQNQLDIGQAPKALHTLKPVLRQYPKNHRVLTLSGLAHMAVGNSSRALRLLKAARTAHPSARTHLNLSSALISMGHTKYARAELRRALDFKDYEFVERIWHNVAVSFEKDKNYPKAVTYYRRALYEHPTYYQAMYRLGLVFKATGRLREAATQLKNSTDFCQICIEPVRELADIYMKSGQPGLAVKTISRFLARRNLKKRDRLEAKQLLKIARDRRVSPASTNKVRR